MKYTLIYLPVDKPRIDGCILIRSDGKTFEYLKSDDLHSSYLAICKVAELFFVTYEYNKMIVVGRPSEGALKWLKVGESVMFADCKHVPMPEYDLGGSLMIHVKCPTCGVLH